jgi:hypothetical protein
MRSLTLSLGLLLAGAVLAAGEEPPPLPLPPPSPPEAGLSPPPIPAPAPVPMVPEPWAPPPVVVEPFWLVSPGQPPYGPHLRASPAESVAMLEAGGPVFANDPRVTSAAVLLTKLTAAYVEDAPRIATLTIRVVQEIRAGNLAASPMEMMVEATRWKQPPDTRGNIPRTFEAFARAYRSARIEPGTSQPAAPSPMPTPPSVASPP